MGFAEALRTHMDARRISGRALARKVWCDDALISRYVNGKQRPSRRMAQLIDDALDAGGELVNAASNAAPSRRTGLAGGLLAGSLLSVGPQAPERLAWTARNPPQIDASAVESLADMLASQRRIEDALGAAAVLNPVLAQLAEVENLVAQARGPIRPALINIAQQWAQFTAYLHRDAGDTVAEHLRLAQALGWGNEIDGRTMIATGLRAKGRRALLAGEAGSAVGRS